MRYDKAGRLVFSQDGNQRSKTAKEWTFYLHDAFGRPVVTGIWVSATVPNISGTVVKATYDATGTKLGGYNVNLTLPSTVKLMTVNYYDDYRFRRIQTVLADTTKLRSVAPPSGYGSPHPNYTSPDGRGLLTGTRTYQLDDPTKYTVSALYYDHRGRVVQGHTSNPLGGFDNEYFAYTFTGKVKQRQQVHSVPQKDTQTETCYYDYGTPATNPTERLLSVSHKLNSAAQVTLAQYTYDDAGRVRTKQLANETTTYNYNVRGWLTQISGTKFNQTLTYNTAVNGLTPAKELYNGNISAVKWKSGDETTERGYKFTYDNLSRLTAAAYGESANLTSNPNQFNEVVTYNDKVVNIKTLQRRGKLDSGYGEIDNLTYAYTGNKLTKVHDAVTTPITYEGAFHFVDRANVDNEYAYDKNGNLAKDLNKNITSITYNSLNLPEVITYSGGGTITYVYDGVGSKLSVVYQSGGVTTRMDYVANKVYRNGTISMLLTEEGYATFSGTTPTYYYYLKDHQGNNRVVVNQSDTVQQVNHYYPFGGLFGEGLQTSKQPYKYNGKEFDRQFGLDLYDYGTRYYDPAIGRWGNPDPLLEKYYNISPYVYVANNPVRFIDPNGMWYGDPPLNWLIPARPKYEYGNNQLTNSLTFVNNVSANILNSGISIINTPINAAQTLYKEGVGGLVNSEIAGLRNAGNAIADEVNYTLTTSLGEQLQGFKNPATWEAGVAFGAALFTGSVAANLGKGVSATTATATKAGTQTVYRVFGGDARAQGFSWTNVNPTSVKDFRNVAGLPSGGTSGAMNTADFMIKGKVNTNSIIKSRSALPLDGNKGGLPELIIDPKNVRLTDFKVLKP